jgi:hypothetical protein
MSLESIPFMSTDDTVRSLAPDSPEPILVKPDGREFDGNTRVKVFEERGYDIELLPRTSIP